MLIPFSSIIVDIAVLYDGGKMACFEERGERTLAIAVREEGPEAKFKNEGTQECVKGEGGGGRGGAGRCHTFMNRRWQSLQQHH